MSRSGGRARIRSKSRSAKGFWIGKYEVTQGEWKRVMGSLPGELSAGRRGPAIRFTTMNFAEAEEFCHKLTEQGHALRRSAEEWEFRLPTEAQWEYACRAGTTTATSFGDSLSSTQANFQGEPYNGGDARPLAQTGAPKSAATRRTPGAYTTCTATSLNGAATGTA